MARKTRIEPYNGPAGGWGSLKSVADILIRERVGPVNAAQLRRQNKPDGYMCVSCAWPKPAHPHPAEFCENGAKATAWEITSLRTSPEFFCSAHRHRAVGLGRLRSRAAGAPYPSDAL